jgi:hypothetical protein
MASPLNKRKVRQHPPFLGQGSGASPAIWLWLLISVVLLSSLWRLIPREMIFESPSQHIVLSQLSDSFVSDTHQNGINDAHLSQPLSLSTLIRNLESMAQTWERLLFSSGGALEPSKCFYSVVYWKWINGLPTMTPVSEMTHVPPIQLTSGFDISTGSFGSPSYNYQASQYHVLQQIAGYFSSHNWRRQRAIHVSPRDNQPDYWTG